MTDGWKVEVTQTKDGPPWVRISVQDVPILAGYVTNDLREPAKQSETEAALRDARADNAWLRSVVGEAMRDLNIRDNAEPGDVRAAAATARSTLLRVIPTPASKGRPIKDNPQA